MAIRCKVKESIRFAAAVLAAGLTIAACSGGAPAPAGPAAGAPAESRFAAPADLQPVALGEDERLQLVATTSLIADTIRRVAGERATVHTLIPPDVDPHAYVAAPRDLVALETAHAVFVNGLGLEESLLPAILEAGGGAPLIEVNAGVEPIALGDAEGHAAAGANAQDEHADEHSHGGLDPHTWQDVASVQIWATNVSEALAALDPAHADAYREAAGAYRTELDGLDAEVRATLAAIPPGERKLVTDHYNLLYFARAYDFTVVGAVIPSLSTLATLSAQERAALQDQIEQEGVRAIFIGNTANNDVAGQLAADTGVEVVRLFTGSLTAADGPAPTYVEMMRYNAAAIAEALQTAPPN